MRSAMSMLPKKASSMRAKAFRLPPASTTAIFIGTLMASALACAERTTACACASVMSPGRVLTGLAAKAGAARASSRAAVGISFISISLKLKNYCSLIKHYFCLWVNGNIGKVNRPSEHNVSDGLFECCRIAQASAFKHRHFFQLAQYLRGNVDEAEGKHPHHQP